MKIRAIPLIIILLLGLSFADLTCTGDATPNLGTNFNINCLTRASQSKCYALVWDNSTTPISMGEYPQYPYIIPREDRTPYITHDTGQFMVTIFLNDKVYFTSSEYDVNITCLDPSDNSTNETTFTFQPSGYPPLAFLDPAIEFANSNSILLIAFLLLIFLAVAYFFIQILFNR